MPGVHLDFLPASQAVEALDTPDRTCAESGLEEVVGDLLTQNDDEDEEEFNEKKFDLRLRCAVREIHSDLQAFGKRVDACLEEAAAQVAPLAEAISKLQEENLKLKTEQERMVRQVEALLQVTGLPDPKLHQFSKESYSILDETQTLPNESSITTHEETTPEASRDGSACSFQDAASRTPQEPTASLINMIEQDDVTLHDPTNIPEDDVPILQASAAPSEMNSPQESEPSPISHSLTFATHRSLSAPSLRTNSSSNCSTVPLSVNPSHHGPF